MDTLSFVPPDVRTWAEIDLGAIRHNLGVVRSRIGPEAGILGVVKANAYGHGVTQVAPAIADLVSFFGVANLVEAREVAALHLGREVLVLGPCLPAERAAAVAEGILCSVSTVEEAEAYAQAGAGREAQLNLKVDTGMGRIGVWQDQAVEVVEALSRLPGVALRMISTHLPVADEDAGFTEAQLATFQRLAREFARIAPGAKIHALNSGGIFGFSQYTGDLVRAGLLLYGSAYPADYQPLLQPALSWKARIVLIRDTPAGRSISYGRTFITPRPMRIATLPVGYADGFPRQASGQGAQVLIRGRRCAVLGRVTMDQILVDVSEIPDGEVGDEAVLIGRQGDAEILARELADQGGTISWDIFTGIAYRVPRFYFNQPLTAKP